MIVIMLAFALQGMTDADYNAARERENPTVAQAQSVVTEAIRRGEACDPESTRAVCSGYGDVGDRDGATRPSDQQCIIESEHAHDVRAVNAALAVARQLRPARGERGRPARRGRLSWPPSAPGWGWTS